MDDSKHFIENAVCSVLFKSEGHCYSNRKSVSLKKRMMDVMKYLTELLFLWIRYFHFTKLLYDFRILFVIFEQVIPDRLIHVFHFHYVVKKWSVPPFGFQTASHTALQWHEWINDDRIVIFNKLFLSVSALRQQVI